MKRYEYLRPTTLDEALALAERFPGARYICGGTDILVQLRKRTAPPPDALISLRRVEELRGIEAGERLRIGAGASLVEIAEHPAVQNAFPALIESIAVLGSRQIRNVATLGGNLCNASPAADTAPPLLVHGAAVELRSATGTRELPLEEFFLGPGQSALESGELLTAVLLEPDSRSSSTYLRKGRVAMDLALVGVAALLELDGRRCIRARLAACSVAPTPVRLRRVEALLEGRELDPGDLAFTREPARADVAPIDDLRTSAAYRLELVGVLAERALRRLLTRDEAELEVVR